MFNRRVKNALFDCQLELTTLLNTVVGSGAILAVCIDMAGRIVSANSRFAETLGYSLERLSKMAVSEIMTEPHAVFSPNPYAIERHLFLTADGRPVELSFGWISVEKGAFQGYGFVTQSYTKYDQVAIEWNRSMAIAQYNLAGEVLHANQSFIQVVGYGVAEIVGMNHRMFCLAEDVVSFHHTEFWEDLNKGMIKAGRFRRINKNGQILWLEGCYSPIKDAMGRVYKIVMFSSAVTE